MSQLYLVVGIDTESDNQWDVRCREHPTFENIIALPRLHERFVKYGARPTYLVTYPVVATPAAAEVVAGLQSRGDCEIGAHHHAWETPPCAPADVHRHGYASSLPVDQFERQLQRLTEAIESTVGRPPVSYRSGRFGFSAAHVSALERLGYRVESSVAPLFDESHKGGPDFVGATLRPYYLAYDDARVPGSSSVLEVPVSAALSRRVPAWVERAYAKAPSPYVTKRVLRALRLARMIWLRPSYSSLDDMRALARRIERESIGVLNVLFHSSEAIVGGSPYNRSEAELDGFFDTLESFLAFATEELDAVPLTFSEFQAAWCAPRSDRRAEAHTPRRPPGVAVGA
jgi:hypothetical protein